MTSDHWRTIKSLPQLSLSELFESNDKRLAKLGLEQSGLYFDFSKTHLNDEALQAFQGLADHLGLSAKTKALLSGEPINISEGRAAEHCAERGIGNLASVENARALHLRMKSLIEVIDSGALGEFTQIIHLGIGGSALGPKMLHQALKLGDEKYELAVVSNIDGCALEPVLERFDAGKVLLVIASKTFTTAETLLNAQSVIDWMREQGVADPLGQVVALTADPEQAVQWGVDETRILPFSETVGGRYSLWSSIGFSVALALGYDVFAELLDGAAAMDQHFQEASWDQNIPVLAAFADQYYAQVRECETRAVFAYDERLGLLPDYLQQLEMESNGKSVTVDGEPLSLHSSPIVWGGVGTDAQHAVFQLLHQGSHLVPVEFLAVIEPGDSLNPSHHNGLLLNCFAQGAALMAGKKSDDSHRNYPGDRPSVTILLEQLEARSLGALLAFYEHRTFVNAVLLNINPFDQFGVELGKQMAGKLAADDGNRLDASTEELKKRAFGV
ncbi:MAG: glucose-6-phosphate isomerase [Sphingomonadales bacterium]|nr:glucose-6-phosphate isomerase [Sphingomonadales bacterium]PIX66934.1 MAG: glucose-6-phosphate isomerase [Sphingomonadales bacterium CG_4_10_14_3_um_filter_58_15]NCO48558.1 glucose-6-phosphate isomerase [Sphingomonadales bacterium]NCO99855.1 glucose-6-phosphate isomerase [Sphingomonadales bacterium]NCP26503.1 glucose-6-phosphate isomerase [Sphingomonadales bacterium]